MMSQLENSGVRELPFCTKKINQFLLLKWPLTRLDEAYSPQVIICLLHLWIQL